MIDMDAYQDAPALEDTDESYELEQLMAESPADDNYGSQRSRLTYRDSPLHDGHFAPAERRTLNGHERQMSSWVAGGGVEVVTESFAHFSGMTSGRTRTDGNRTLSHAEEATVDRDALRAAALHKLGMTDAEMKSIDQPLNTPALQAIRNRLGDQLLALHEAGGNMADLARILGWKFTAGTNGTSCGRMTKALSSARKRRAAAEAFAPEPQTIGADEVTCERQDCEATFHPAGESDIWCSTDCRVEDQVFSALAGVSASTARLRERVAVHGAR